MRVLVVEDEKKIANAIKKGLEQESFAVDLVYSGIDGYDLASSETYDVIVLDWMLPVLSGLEICKKLRQTKIFTPVLMLTARSDVDNRVEGLNSGADDYLSKPFDFSELIARIRALSRRPRTSQSVELSYEGLRLNAITHEIYRDGKTLKLSKKEFALLEYLLKNKEKIVCKEQIIEHCWNFDADVLPNTVEVYIGYLRKKLDKPFRTKLIHTVRGFGYRLGEN